MIDYSILTVAINYYRSRGYEFIEVPWTVPRDIITITANEDTNFEDNKFMGSYLVGSAEQSFLHLIKNKELPFGKYCAITPCFRNDELDELHQKYFMKLELINYLGVPGLTKKSKVLEKMIETARAFFNSYVPTDIVKTEDDRSEVSYDLECDGVELGSYGIRHYAGYSWTYGTGLAEPRFSYVRERIKN